MCKFCGSLNFFCQALQTFHPWRIVVNKDQKILLFALILAPIFFAKIDPTQIFFTNAADKHCYAKPLHDNLSAQGNTVGETTAKIFFTKKKNSPFA